MSDDASAADRNWNELLQELRVTQTGLQVLTGFLVTIPFQQRFTSLSTGQEVLYLCTLSVAVLATVLVLAPAVFHRLLFRQQEKEWLVTTANIFARAGLLLAGVAICGVAWLIFDVVLGTAAGVAAVITTVVVFVGVWLIVPLVFRRRSALASTPSHSPRS